jgi:hypothetical protein
MNLQEIKNAVGVSTLELNTANDAAGAPTDWMRHWDDKNRVAISIHKDLVADIKATPGITTLGLQSEIRTGARGEYKSYRIVKYSPAETTL